MADVSSPEVAVEVPTMTVDQPAQVTPSSTEDCAEAPLPDDALNRFLVNQFHDNRTRKTVLKLRNGGTIKELHGTVNAGKEAIVCLVTLVEEGKEDEPPRERRAAAKIYQTVNLAFKDRDKYMIGERRFEHYNKNKLVNLWAEKEFRNLRRIHKAKIPCPRPRHLRNNVVIMDFLGDADGKALPRLADSKPAKGGGSQPTDLAGEDAQSVWFDLYEQSLVIMRRLWAVCNLVHGDFSEYNVLYDEATNQLYLIDVSQSVEPSHPNALFFLRRDIKTIGAFFRRKGVDTLSDRLVYKLVTDSGGPVEEGDIEARLQELYDNRAPIADQDDFEVDEEVFRQQFIPQSLLEAKDHDLDAAPGSNTALYDHFLADKAGDDDDIELDASDDESGSESGSSSEAGSGREDRSGRTPRGHRHEDRQEKKERKAETKASQRERRENKKLTKSEKKALIAKTSRKKR